MPNILIAGGGFAGVWSAAAAARVLRLQGARLSITLVSPDEGMVIRPRLYEAQPDTMTVPLARILDPIQVSHVVGTIEGIDPSRRYATVKGTSDKVKNLPYDRLVLATGSALTPPNIPGSKQVHNVDTLGAAMVLDSHIRALPDLPPHPGRYTAVVVGAGFTGVEVATELVPRLRAVAATDECGDDEVRIVLVERAREVAPDLGPGPRPIIQKALDDLAIELQLGTTPMAVDASGVSLSNGMEIPALTIVWTAGMQASHLTLEIPGKRDRLGRLHVDQYLEVFGVPGVYAAGDTAAVPTAGEYGVLQSCQHASPLGKYAGHNVAADLLGLPRAQFRAPPYVTCLDLGPAGAVFTTGFDRQVRLTGARAKQVKRDINRKFIYPPSGDAARLLRLADHELVNPFLRLKNENVRNDHIS